MELVGYISQENLWEATCCRKYFNIMQQCVFVQKGGQKALCNAEFLNAQLELCFGMCLLCWTDCVVNASRPSMVTKDIFSTQSLTSVHISQQESTLCIILVFFLLFWLSQTYCVLFFNSLHLCRLNPTIRMGLISSSAPSFPELSRGKIGLPKRR